MPDLLGSAVIFVLIFRFRVLLYVREQHSIDLLYQCWSLEDGTWQ